MNDHNIRKATLAEIRRMKTAGELFINKDALNQSEPEGEKLNSDFWSNAKVEPPKLSREKRD